MAAEGGTRKQRPPGMYRTAEERRVTHAKTQVVMGLENLQDEHSLTDLEVFEAILQWQQTHLKFMLRAERGQIPPDDEECTASSWGGYSHKPYGPGGWNQCLLRGDHDEHRDGFGNVFLFNPDAKGGNKDPRVKVLRRESSPEFAE